MSSSVFGSVAPTQTTTTTTWAETNSNRLAARLSSLSTCLLAILLVLQISLVGAQTDDRCLEASQQVQSIIERASNADVVFIEASVAYGCLRSVPLDVDAATKLINELKLYISWQSNIIYYSNPPADYNEDQVDVIAELDGILNNVQNGNYTNEFDVHDDISLALAFAYDFHFRFQTDILSQFLFSRGLPGELALVSISEDGKSIPKLYNYYELRDNGVASPIVKINGEDADDYLDYFARYSPYHDEDARYNRQLYNQAGAALGDPVLDFSISFNFDQRNLDETVIEHENGTEVTYINYARTLDSTVTAKFYNGISSGEEFFAAFCDLPDDFPPAFIQQINGALDGSLKPRDERTITREYFEKMKRDPAVERERKEKRQSDLSLIGYPQPVSITDDGTLSGYFLTGADYDDIAVLAVPSFSPEGRNSGALWQDTLQNFLQTATRAGKTRLVIDLRNNGGGRVFLGYDLFKQLFPSEDPYGATRFRANDAFNVAGIALTEQLKNYNYEDAVQDYFQTTYDDKVWLAWRSMFNYRLNLDENLEPFTSWPDMFGPNTFNGDKFTALQRYNFNDMFADDLDIDVSGYGARADALGDQPFEAANIVLLQDGSCGSTCAIFSELAKAQARIHQVVIGGQPEEEAMQSVAGSKGAQVWGFDRVFLEAYVTYTTVSEDQPDALANTEIEALANALTPLRRTMWSYESGETWSSINLRDNIRRGDDSQTPLEFTYEAADCRLFYTAEMMDDVTLVWKAAADARWGNYENCVPRSVGHDTSLSGGTEVPGSDVADSKASAFGASALGVVLAVVAAMAMF